MANASPSRSGFGPWKVPRLGDSHRVERPATRIVTGTVGGWTDTPDSAPRLRQRPENSGALIRMELELRWNPTLQNALIRVHWCAAVRCCVAAGAPSSSAVVEVPKFKSRQPPLSAGFVLHPSHLPLSPFRSPFRIANLARCSRAELPSRLFRSPGSLSQAFHPRRMFDQRRGSRVNTNLGSDCDAASMSTRPVHTRRTGLHEFGYLLLTRVSTE